MEKENNTFDGLIEELLTTIGKAFIDSMLTGNDAEKPVEKADVKEEPKEVEVAEESRIEKPREVRPWAIIPLPMDCVSRDEVFIKSKRFLNNYYELLTLGYTEDEIAEEFCTTTTRVNETVKYAVNVMRAATIAKIRGLKEAGYTKTEVSYITDYYPDVVERFWGLKATVRYNEKEN